MKINLFQQQNYFYNCNKLEKRIEENKKNNSYSNTDLSYLPVYFPQKNNISFQSLAKENEHKETIIKNFIKSYDLKIRPQDLNYLLNNSPKEIKYQRYIQTGEAFFNLHLKEYLLEKYPYKRAEELFQIEKTIEYNHDKINSFNEILPNYIMKRSNNDFCNGLMGLIVLSDRDEKKKNLSNFLSKHIFPNIFSDENKIEKNSLELLVDEVKKRNKDPEDIYIKKFFSKTKKHHEIYYKNILLSKIKSDEKDKEAKNIAIQKAIETIKENPNCLEDAKEKTPYTQFGYPDEKRISILNEFQKNYNLNFNNINLLHRAFLQGKMPDNTTIPNKHSYKPLNYIGKSILNTYFLKLCDELYPYTNKTFIRSLSKNLSTSKYIANISQEIGLDDLSLNEEKTISLKALSSFFTALTGAIYLDDKENGYKNAFNFLEQNFHDEFAYLLKINITGDTSTLKDIIDNEQLIEKLKKLNLNLSEETLRFITEKTPQEYPLINEYKRTGKLLYCSYLKGLMYKTFPQKNESFLTNLCLQSAFGTPAKIRDEIAKEILGKDIFEEINKKDLNNLYKDFIYTLLGASIHENKQDGNKITAEFFEKHIKPTIINTLKSDEDINKYINKNKIFEPKLTFEQENKLISLKKRYDIKISNLNLLNKAFTFGFNQDGTPIAHAKTYETLEFVGDEILRYCTREILKDNLPFHLQKEVGKKSMAFITNENLINLSKRMNLIDYNANIYNKDNLEEKTHADLLEALIGAIYIDGGRNGLNNVFHFLYKNFKYDILNA